jgi:hypothetical protein
MNKNIFVDFCVGIIGHKAEMMFQGQIKIQLYKIPKNHGQRHQDQQR